MLNVGLVSTHWDVALKNDAIDREADLVSTDWSLMLANGARKYRLSNDTDSAKQMVVDMLQSQPRFIKIQKEMAKEFGKKSLSETEAGKGVCKELLGRIEKEQADLHELEQCLAKGAFMEPSVKDLPEKQVAESRLRLHRLRTDRKNVERVPSWGATTWDLTKRHGLGIVNLALQIRGNSAATSATTNRIASLEVQLAASQAAVQAAQKTGTSSLGVGVVAAVAVTGAKILGWL